jgi:DNA repair protein RadC
MKQNQVAEVKLTYVNNVKPSERIQIKTSESAFRVFWDNWDKETIEHIEEMKLLLLNRSHKVLGVVNLFKGGSSGTIVDVKIIFQYTLKANATSIIICHNHPSGNLQPSDNDKNITNKLRNGAALLDITFLDHLIITPEEKYYSMADEG